MGSNSAYSGTRIMKKSLYLLPVLALALVGCSGPIPDADTQAQSASSDKKTALGRSMDLGKGVATDNYISQINQALSSVKGEDGKPPATLEDAKKALKDFPAEMWVDDATGKALQYHPETGTVSR
ncbi:hypothetical protein IAD21_05324 [Abditibacteriota bacterium]|nr:hypothetical protein IAD21_05324 [Abditibacteriota bacterium]